MSADARKRQNLVVTLRHAGKNYREIGDVLGVSVTRARQVYLKAMKDRMTDEKLLLALMTAIDERFDGMGMEETRAGVRLQIMAALDQAKKYLESL